MSFMNCETLPDVIGYLAIYAAWLVAIYVVVHAGWL
jgi:hypothetical protein